MLTFKEAMQYFFNVFMLIKTVFYFKLNFILKYTQKLVFLKTLKKNQKT